MSNWKIFHKFTKFIIQYSLSSTNITNLFLNLIKISTNSGNLREIVQKYINTKLLNCQKTKNKKIYLYKKKS